MPLLRSNSGWVATLLPAILGCGACALSVKTFEQYGWSLFILLPIFVSMLSAFLWGYKRKISYRSSYLVALSSTLYLGLFILLFALDGLICLLMALPLAALLSSIGAWLGWLLARAVSNPKGNALIVLISCSFPFFVAFEHSQEVSPPLRQVQTKVLIKGSIEEVWEQVIAFPKITTPPTGLFRTGIAYPVEARIEGHGVGAIRYCTFSTGDFVEPITVWDAPNKLAFSVTASPAPMKELSIYDHVHAPHLEDHLQSQKGQFVLQQTEDGVLLEGTTWYTHSIAPDFYWGLISDEIIHRIHLRVLHHIREVVERP